MFTNSEEPNEFGQIVLTMPQKLHRQHGGLNVFVGQKSITKELLSQKNFKNSDRIPGSTLLGKGKLVHHIAMDLFHPVLTGMTSSNGALWRCKTNMTERLKRKNSASPRQEGKLLLQALLQQQQKLLQQ